MIWFGKRRQRIELSQLFADGLEYLLKVTRSRMGFYLSGVDDDSCELILRNYTAYVSVLMRHAVSILLSSRRLRVVGGDSNDVDVDEAWKTGLDLALQMHAKSAEDYQRALNECVEAVHSYQAAHERDCADGLTAPADMYFSATRHFADLIADIHAPHRRAVFSIAADMADVVSAVCKGVPKRFEVYVGMSCREKAEEEVS